MVFSETPGLTNAQEKNTMIFYVCHSRPWLLKNIGSLQLFVYTYLRVIEDHEAVRLKVLRQQEVEFCVQLIREQVRTKQFLIKVVL